MLSDKSPTTAAFQLTVIVPVMLPPCSAVAGEAVGAADGDAVGVDVGLTVSTAVGAEVALKVKFVGAGVA